jgi:hypothetical protein
MTAILSSAGLTGSCDLIARRADREYGCPLDEGRMWAQIRPDEDATAIP